MFNLYASISSAIFRIILAFCLFESFFLTANEWIIIANGPPLSKEQTIQTMINRKVLALDGACNILKEYDLFPDVILGDFDSINHNTFWGIQETFEEVNEQSYPYYGNYNILIIPAKNQAFSDLEKGIQYCDNQKAKSIIIINAIGGRLDHTLGNIGILRKYYNTNRQLIIQTLQEKIEYIKDSLTIIRGKVGDKCAILGYPKAYMTSEGLAYNGIAYPLILGIQESICNSLAQPEAHILIQGEAIIIHPNHEYLP